MSAAADYVNLLDVITERRTLPDGYDAWAIRSVRPDLTSSNDYRYPFPGSIAEAPGPINERSTDPCPTSIGDGICAAGNWYGMASGGIVARTLLLVAYRNEDVLGGAMPEKIRLHRFLVVDLLDGEALLRKFGTGANLSRANLYGANLYGANLSRANLYGADLSRADLTGVNYLTAEQVASAHTDRWTRLPSGLVVPTVATA